ncbi:D-allulose 6-phosphate 3-epimerase [Pectinatus frisingensis]|jgi:D-allulose-6-phosphate 3-epimerase|uniref:D-allulose 6-phosphate 3-epimerase n=1 Tax=Pectinatus frisingensis TaxID=865 RepID=UPI001E47BDFC|nr:D-allulose 6-phosphate 3-epimerase [Pectinatus frisingensis]
MTIEFAPSLMCMDLLNVKQQITVLNTRCDYYHIDIMDGHFVKNLCLSIDFVRNLKKITKRPLDCHLMTTNPENYVDQLIDIGVDYISLHAETLNGQAFRLIDKIKQANLNFGIVLNPETNLSTVKIYLHAANLLTIMTVDPGFAGQSFITESLDKIRQAADMKSECGYGYKIAVDGGCNKTTYKRLKQAGAECLIVGSSGLFRLDENINTAYDMMLKEYKEVC